MRCVPPRPSHSCGDLRTEVKRVGRIVISPLFSYRDTGVRGGRELLPPTAVQQNGSGSREEASVKKGFVAAVASAAVVLAAVGCGFFESSGPEGGVSPIVSNYRVSPSIVSCDRDFVISFSWSDPQGDVEFMRVTYRHDDGFTIEEEVLWEHGGGLFGLEDLDLTEEELEELDQPGFLDLSVPGEATYTTQFDCDVGLPRGVYSITVVLIDDNGHESRPRTDTLRLTSS